MAQFGVRPRTAPGLLGRTTVEQIAQHLQFLETGVQPEPGSRPDLVVVQANGEVLSRTAHTLEQQAVVHMRNAQQEIAAFWRQLANEPKEEVTNWEETPFYGALNGAKYRVPGRTRKLLPRTLAAHYRSKMSYLDRQTGFEQALGGVGPSDNDSLQPEMHDYTALKRILDGFDKVGVDPGTRNFYF